MKIDLRYDIGNMERFINIFPWFRLGFILFCDLIKLFFKSFIFFIKGV